MQLHSPKKFVTGIDSVVADRYTRHNNTATIPERKRRMKRTCLLFAALAVSLLAGCASGPREGIPQYVDAAPTAQTVNADGKIYLGTLIKPSDFKADGSPKKLADYDFTAETAPCTVLGQAPNYGKSPSVAVVKKGDQSFYFICRGVSSRELEQKRLYLAGTKTECLSRYESYVRHPVQELEKAGSLCGGMTQSSPPSRTEVAYKEVVNSTNVAATH
jgi:hypothetical protein